MTSKRIINEASLLAEVRAHKPGALDHLLREYQDYLTQLIRFRFDPGINQRLDPSDVVQETQLEVARRMDEYFTLDTPLSFRLWLRQIALDKLHKAYRYHVGAARRSLQKEIPLPERSSLLIAKKLTGGHTTPSSYVSVKEMVHYVKSALSELSELDQEIVLMHNLEQLSYDDICQVLQISPGAAKMRHARAVLRLSRLLKQKGLLVSES